MAKPPRDLSRTGFQTYFITARTWQGRPILGSEQLAQLFLTTLFDYRTQGKYRLHEFVAMPNHFHLLLTPLGITVARALQLIKGGFSHRAGQELGRSFEIWQRGYVEHRIRDAADYARHQEYIRQNPVRARLVQAAEDYPYASAHPSFELDPVPQGLKARSWDHAERHD